MPPVKKVRIVEQLVDKLSRCSVAVATDLRGMSVNDMTQLRHHLRAQGIEYRAIKNTLAERAAEATGHPEIKEILEGPTGLAFGYGDPVQPVKTLMEYIRTNRIPMVVRAAVLEGRVFNGAQLSVLSTLPSRKVLVAQLTGQLASPLVRLVTVLNQPMVGLMNTLSNPLRSLVTVLQQRVAQQGGA